VKAALRKRPARAARLLFVFFALSFLSAGARAATLNGTAKNGTTGKPAAGIEVILLRLQGGMQPVANTKTDAQGHFTFDNAGIGAEPMLVRAVYNGINFHQPVPPDKTTGVEVEVFEPTTDPKTITIPSRVVFFQPSGTTLIVGEEYSVQNDSQPPRAFYKQSGNFAFRLPEGAKLQQVAAAGPAGMPVVQAPIESQDGVAIAYAFRPGSSTVRYSYELPYANNTALVKVLVGYATARLLVVAPPTMQISGDGLQLGGQEQGMNIYGREKVAAGTTMAINVSGTAPPPQDNAGNAAETPQDAANARSSEVNSGANIQQAPGRLDGAKWYVVGVAVVVFGLLAFLLARKPVLVPNTASSVLAAPSAALSPAASVPPASAVPSLAHVDVEVNNSLDGLKDKLFRLELRRQAGTISDEEYATERARAEKILRELVRG
jgi:hypothetical protein